jgi:hypothetical protein
MLYFRPKGQFHIAHQRTNNNSGQILLQSYSENEKAGIDEQGSTVHPFGQSPGAAADVARTL